MPKLALRPPRVATVAVLGMALNVAALGGLSQPASAATVSVSVNPPTVTAQPGQSFDVTITIASDVQTRGVQFGLDYDPSVVQVSKLTVGDYYQNWAKSNQASATEAIPFRVDNTDGKVVPGAIVILGGTPKAGVSGSGTLLTLSCTAQSGASGSTTMNINSLVLSDTNATTIHGVKITGATVAIGVTAVPSPAAAAAPPTPQPASSSAAPKSSPVAAANPAAARPLPPAASPTVAASPAGQTQALTATPIPPATTTAPTSTPTTAAVGPGIPTAVPVIVPSGSPGMLIPWEAVGGFGGGVVATAAVMYALRRPDA
jgi:hypothetical protein